MKQELLERIKRQETLMKGTDKELRQVAEFFRFLVNYIHLPKDFKDEVLRVTEAELNRLEDLKDGHNESMEIIKEQIKKKEYEICKICGESLLDDNNDSSNIELGICNRCLGDMILTKW